MTIDIEKLADECGAYIASEDQGETPFMVRGEMIFDSESLYKFAEAYTDKVLQEQSAEIAQLKEKFKSYKEESLNEIVSLNKACYEYKTNINDLREALEKTATKVITDGNPSTTYLYEDIHTALATTPAQSLIEHDNEVIEKCAKVCDEHGAIWVAKSIRALKATND